MNERIRELAEQVYGSAHYDDFKFAELIVKECAAHLNFVGDEYAGIELLEHFGVEE